MDSNEHAAHLEAWDAPDSMSEPCYQYWCDSRQQLGYFGFVCQTCLHMDVVAKACAEALHREAQSPEERERYRQAMAVERPVTRQLVEFRTVMLQMLNCRAVDNYLIYVSGLLASIFTTRPETMKSSEPVKLEFVLSHRTMDELVPRLAEKRVNELSYQGMRDLCEYLAKRLGFALFEEKGDLERAVRVVEGRNLVAHNRGVINAVYLSRLPDATVHLGDVLDFDVDQFFDDAAFLARSVRDIDERAAAKFGIPRPRALEDLPTLPVR